MVRGKTCGYIISKDDDYCDMYISDTVHQFINIMS